MTKTDEPSVVSIQYRCLAHAYALNRSFASRIVQESWNNIPFDNLLSNHCQNFFAIYPMIAFQSQASTDNQTIAIDKIRRFFGGLPFIQKTNEFFQRHKFPIIYSHLIFLAVMTLIIVKSCS